MHNFKSKGFGVKQREPCTRAAKNMYGLWVSWHWHEFLYLYETVYISRDGPYLLGILEGKQVHDAIMKLMPIWPGHIDWTNMNEPTNWHGFWGHGKPKHPKSSKYPSARGKIKGVFHIWKQRNFRFFMVKHIVKSFSFSLHLVETSHFKNDSVRNVIWRVPPFGILSILLKNDKWCFLWISQKRMHEGTLNLVSTCSQDPKEQI